MCVKKKTTITVQAEVPTHLAPLYEKGYTTVEVARSIGCTPGHLVKAMKGERKLSDELTAKINALPKKALQLAS